MPRASRKPYILFTTITGTPHGRITLWRRYRSKLLTALVELDTTGKTPPHSRRPTRRGRTHATELPELRTAVIWRLFSANHRELGGSATYFADFTAARNDARHWATHAGTLIAYRVMNQPLDRYSWFLTFDGEPVVISHRWYPSWRDRNTAALAALKALPDVVVAEHLNDIVPGHKGDLDRIPMLEEDTPETAPGTGSKRGIISVRDQPDRNRSWWSPHD
jgi:hypothetical protein